MPSYKGRRSIDYGGNLKNCGFYIQFTHLSSGTRASFVGEVTDFKDAYTSKWEEKPVYGRMDPISTFQRTGRKISISWKIINEDEQTGIANMLEIQKLIHFLYPDYYDEENNASTISGGPVLRLKFANLSSTNSGAGLVGYLDGFTFDPDFNSSFVKAGKDSITGKDSIISTVINASINFTVLHTRKLGWTKERRRGGVFPYRYTDKELREAEAGTSFKTQSTEGLRSASSTSTTAGETKESDEAPDAVNATEAFRRAGVLVNTFRGVSQLAAGIQELQTGLGSFPGTSAAGNLKKQEEKSAKSEPADLGVDGVEYNPRFRPTTRSAHNSFEQYTHGDKTDPESE